MKKFTYIITAFLIMLAISGCGAGTEVTDQAGGENNRKEGSHVESKLPDGDLITFEEAHEWIEGDINIRASDVEDWYSIELTEDTYTLYTDLLVGTEGSHVYELLNFRT